MRKRHDSPQPSRAVQRGMQRFQRRQAEIAALQTDIDASKTQGAVAQSHTRLTDIATALDREARRRAAQELREMGEPEAALICEAGLQFPSD